MLLFPVLHRWPHLNSVLASLLLFVSFSITAETQFLTHNLKHSVMTNSEGELVGIKHAGRRAFNLELVKAMAEHAGREFKPIEVPFLRGYEMVTSLSGYALFNISRNSERENKVKWVGPLQEDKVYFFETTSQNSPLMHFNEIDAKTKVCVLRGSRHLKILQSKTRAHLVVANSYDSCFRLLAQKRVDLTPVSLHEVAAIIKATGLDEHLIRKTPVILYQSEGYIAFSVDTQDTEIRLWQKALDKIKANGVYDQLVMDYLRKSN